MGHTRTHFGMAQNHVYDNEISQGPRLGSDHECAEYEQDFGFKAGLDRKRYPWHVSVRKTSNMQPLYGTAYAQNLIWQHQHPLDCKASKFLAMANRKSGLGAIIHFLGRALGMAMGLGRVLILLPRDFDRSFNWFDDAHCEGKSSWDCWLEPFTSCTWSKDLDMVIAHPEDLTRRLNGRFGNLTQHYAPAMFHSMLLRCSRIKRRMWYYWWHAQASTYLLRFNPSTRSLLDDMRGQLVRAQFGDALWFSLHPTLPPGTIGMHARHGIDKGSELQRQPFERFLEQARRLLQRNSSIRVLAPAFSDSNRIFDYDSELYRRHTIFLTTEDPNTFQLAMEAEDWSIISTLENRSMNRSFSGGFNGTLQSFVNLELMLEADAWICQLYSNWCQLVDELRMTVAAKANNPFINLDSAPLYKIGDRDFKAFHRNSYTTL